VNTVQDTITTTEFIYCLPVFGIRIKSKAHRTMILPVVLYGCEIFLHVKGK
jgi:hypothetical protein